MGHKLKEIFLDLLSFNSPRAKVINLSSILFILAVIPVRIVRDGHSICLFKNFIFPFVFGDNCPMQGCECPACGMTRGMSSLLHGKVMDAWNYNKMVFMVFIVMVVMIVVNAIKWKKNGGGSVSKY